MSVMSIVLMLEGIKFVVTVKILESADICICCKWFFLNVNAYSLDE